MGRLYGPSTRLLLTGGGTGGHVIPAIELARAHRALTDAPVIYAGSPDSLESRLAGESRIPFFRVRSSGFVGKSFGGKIRALANLLRGIPEALDVLKDHTPDLVIGTGGYVQIPVVLAAWLRRIPVVLLEPNRVTGLANRLLRPFASKIVFGEGDPDGSLKGIPVPPSVRGVRPECERFLGHPVKIMIMGGSQGAQTINQKVPEILAGLRNTPLWPIEILHQSGERWKEDTKIRYETLGIGARVEGFLSGLSGHLSEQMLVIARAGAMTIAEITASGTPAIYVPYPHAAGGHQEKNARSVEIREAGWCWTEEELADVKARSADLLKILEDRMALLSVAQKAWTLSPAVTGEEWLRSLSLSEK